MDLWIRSQHGRLFKAGYIMQPIEEKFDSISGWVLHGAQQSGARFLLGIYKTKERAIEVLDEIQNVIRINRLFDADINAFQTVLKNEGYTEKEISKYFKVISTYEMPKK